MNQVFDDVLISDGVSVVKGNKEAAAGLDMIFSCCGLTIAVKYETIHRLMLI
jgi:hypothetical protein